MTDWVRLIPHLVHDVRTLVRQGLASAQLVERLAGSGLNPESAALLQSSIQAQQNLNRLIARVGLLAEAESQSNVEHLLELDTAILAAKVHCQAALEGAAAEFHAAAIPGCLVPRAVTKILIELFENSVLYVHPDRPLRISVDATRLGEKVQIAVRDNGSSWDKLHQGKLMQPLERLDSERGGFGLGLAIALALSESCGGVLHGEPGPDGSRFVLEIPANFDEPLPPGQL